MAVRFWATSERCKRVAGRAAAAGMLEKGDRAVRAVVGRASDGVVDWPTTEFVAQAPEQGTPCYGHEGVRCSAWVVTERQAERG